MKVVHLSTYTSGGAGNVACLIHQALLRQGVDSRLLTLFPANPEIPQVVDFRATQRLSYLQKIKQSIRFRWLDARQQQLLRPFPATYEIFSFARTAFDIATHPLIQSADIVHLHWVARWLDFPTFFRKTQRPTVVTLHDLNWVIGGFHYQRDRIRQPKAFLGLNESVLIQKREAIQKAKSLHLVTPSAWLRSQIESTYLARLPTHIIPNGVNTGIFKPLDQQICRNELGLPADKLILLFIAESIDNPHKGRQLLYEALKHLPSENLLLLTVGKGELPAMPMQKLSLGFIADREKLAKIYNAADILVNPTLEDNAPAVVLESLACGTPVIAFPIGGLPELIEQNVTGWLTKATTPKDLRRTIDMCLDNKPLLSSLRPTISRIAQEKWSLENVGRAYQSLYHLIID